MHHKTHKRSGFTLVEIMIVVAIIALLAAIALPSFMRARKRSQATTILNDLRLLDAALDQYATETGKPKGYSAQFGDLQNYLKTDTTLYSSNGVNVAGDTYGPFAVDSIPQVPDNTFNQYSDVADAGFWGQFYGAPSPLGDQFVAALNQVLADLNSGISTSSEQFQADGAAVTQLVQQLSNGGTTDITQVLSPSQLAAATAAQHSIEQIQQGNSGGGGSVN